MWPCEEEVLSTPMQSYCCMIAVSYSYLAKYLICNWRWGVRAFMELEVDGDLAANNGGCQWSVSSGRDPKPLRIFNPATQAPNSIQPVITSTSGNQSSAM